MHACQKKTIGIYVYGKNINKPIYVHIYLHWIEKQAPKIQCTLRVGLSIQTLQFFRCEER